MQTGFGSRQFTVMAVYCAIAAVCLASLIAMLGCWLHGFRLVYTQHKYWAKRRLRCTGLVAVQAVVEVGTGCLGCTPHLKLMQAVCGGSLAGHFVVAAQADVEVLDARRL